MARILSISSQVVRGAIGNSAAAFALQRLGHEVWALPTVVLSNHPGHAHVAGLRVPPETLAAMLDALAANGWLGEVDAIATGYCPTAAHVAFATSVIARVRATGRRPLIHVDPVIGDDPKGVYIEAAAAVAMRDALVPLADVLTPNRFELEWLTGMTVTDSSAARTAARTLGNGRVVLATSVPAAGGALTNVLYSDRAECEIVVLKRPHAPHGTGDLFAALYLGYSLNGQTPDAALAGAAAGVEAALVASAGSDELQLAAAQDASASA
jgi:pyridoxine kinase